MTTGCSKGCLIQKTVGTKCALVQLFDVETACCNGEKGCTALDVSKHIGILHALDTI